LNLIYQNKSFELSRFCALTICNTLFSKAVSYKSDFHNIYVYGGSVSRLEGFVSNREQSYEDPIEE